MCRHACPVFLTTKLDADSPRGHALLVSKIDDGLSDWTDDTVDKIYRCSQCGLCRELCEFDWGEDLLVQAAREKIIGQDRQPRAVSKLAQMLTDLGASHTGAARGLKGLTAASKGHQTDVLYFAGETALYHHPEIVQATGSVLDFLGVNWSLFDRGQTTGIELFELGYRDEAKTAAARLANAIMQIQPRMLVTGCAHAYRAFKETYPQWGIKALKGLQISHTTEFLLERYTSRGLEFKPGPGYPDVAYHDPCQLGRKMGVYDAPRELLTAVTGKPPVELFHNKEQAECCGSGSVMYLTHPELSLKIAKRRMDTVKEEKVGLVVTACPNCKNLLSRAARGRRDGIKVYDLVELIARKIGHGS